MKKLLFLSLLLVGCVDNDMNVGEPVKIKNLTNCNCIIKHSKVSHYIILCNDEYEGVTELTVNKKLVEFCDKD